MHIFGRALKDVAERILHRIFVHPHTGGQLIAGKIIERGFESLVISFDCSDYRTATKWAPGGPTLRLHIGLEHVDDLKADLERGFAAFNAAQ
jgi:hypothetical protein